MDELQGIGNPMEVIFSDTDSIPDLKSISESEDSVIFILTPPNSTDPEDKERNLTLFSNEEMINLTEDKGDNGLTSFDAAMLVNIGNVEGIQTELYDSGVSCHMLPYQDHFENNVPIIPKSITAADKRYFQAIGKGDLQIKISNGPDTTTILLKDVLHCPDMGLMLVSIGKITNAGHKVIFRNTTCKIYDKKDKVIGQITARNGLYRVDHQVAINVAMAGEDQEVLTIKELHWHMGHIAPETARQMVSKGAIKGIEIDSASEIQQCNSCEYAKATQKPIKKSIKAPEQKDLVMKYTLTYGDLHLFKPLATKVTM